MTKRYTIKSVLEVAISAGYIVEKKQSGELLIYRGQGSKLCGVWVLGRCYRVLSAHQGRYVEGAKLPNLAAVTEHLMPDLRPTCPNCNRPLTVQVQSSGSIQHICRTGMRHGDCSYSCTIGGRQKGGQVKGDRKMTRAEIQRNYRRRAEEKKGGQ